MAGAALGLGGAGFPIGLYIAAPFQGGRGVYTAAVAVQVLAGFEIRRILVVSSPHGGAGAGREVDDRLRIAVGQGRIAVKGSPADLAAIGVEADFQLVAGHVAGIVVMAGVAALADGRVQEMGLVRPDHSFAEGVDGRLGQAVFVNRR